MTTAEGLGAADDCESTTIHSFIQGDVSALWTRRCLTLQGDVSALLEGTLQECTLLEGTLLECVVDAGAFFTGSAACPPASSCERTPHSSPQRGAKKHKGNRGALPLRFLFEPLTPLRMVRCLSAFCSNPSLLSAWCAASPLSLRTAHSSPRGALPLRFLCEPLTPLRVQLFSLFPPHSRLLSTEESLASGRRKPWLLVPAKMPATLCGGGHSARHSCAAWTRTHSAARTSLEKTKFLQRGELLHLGAGKREVRPQL